MIRISWLLILCLSANSLVAQRYKERHIRKDIERLEGFENAFVGFALYDPEKKKMLASHYADKHMTPASNTKLFTFWAAQQFLDETTPALEYIVRGDSLIFWSTGYPLTLHQDHRDSTIIDFLSSRKEQLIYWPRPMDDDRYGPGWGWDDFGGYSGAEKSVFPIYGNSIEFIIDNANKTYLMTPAYPGFKVKVSEQKSNRSRVTRDEFWNEFEIKFDSTIDAASPIDTLIRPFRTADQVFVDLLSSAIQQPIKLRRDFERPTKFETLPGVTSDSLYKWMLQPSDNLFAESLLLMASGTFSDTLGTARTIDSLNLAIESNQFKGLNDELIWVDGSGLSRYNMFKPMELITLLKSLNNNSTEARLFELLSQGGVSGTIEDWYAGPENVPYVFAKTGTLSNNHTLSGYIKTRKGKTLIFSLMANHYTVSTSQIRENFQHILERIWAAY